MNEKIVLVDDDNAISATAYNISVDSIKASITFDIRSDFDKYLLDVQNPINKTFLIKRLFPSLHDSSVSMYKDEIDFLGLDSRRFVSMNRNGNEINMKFSIDTLQLINHIESEIKKLKGSLPVHYLFDKGGVVPDFISCDSHLARASSVSTSSVRFASNRSASSALVVLLSEGHRTQSLIRRGVLKSASMGKPKINNAITAGIRK